MISSATYAFIFTGEDDWRVSDVDSWNWDLVEVDGTEPTLGHRKIEGATRKVIKAADGKIVALV